MTRFVLLVGVIAVAGCGPPTSTMSATPDLLAPNEHIIGRSHRQDHVRLLTTAGRIVTVDLRSGESVATALPQGRPGEERWGLAATDDGRQWTLLGYSTLAEIGPRGRIVRRIALEGQYAGVFGGAGRLLLSAVAPHADRAVLYWLDPDTHAMQAAGGLRSVEAATRVDTLAANLAACGATAGDAVPCWFNRGRQIERIQPGGTARVLRLDEVIEESANGLELRVDQPGPIADAFLDASGSTWVLIRPRIGTEGGAFRLARYAADGTLDGVRDVRGPVRLVLDAGDGACLLLVGTGQVQDVSLW